MNPDIAAILHEVRAQIARGLEPDADAFEQRVRAVEPEALPQLRRLLAVHRAKRTLGAPPPSPPPPLPRAPPPTYRAKPTIAANMAVRARARGDVVVLEWDAASGVAAW